jgi:hypothetical protein
MTKTRIVLIALGFFATVATVLLVNALFKYGFILVVIITIATLGYYARQLIKRMTQ